MKLKRLKIIGFKSFADKITLDFHEGITCIVGPNGCGKSNIADAIRWVLGEQSAKSIRGHRMPDVIFAGTEARKGLNFAEVSITFSDVEKALPIGYAELEITRRIHRDGESEYFLNRQPVRLKDIHHLLLDSGLGKSNFSIFEQGKIDQMIQYSPLERRYIFEEAAGITRFLQSKRETLRKMEEVSLNLSRVNDILREVESQVAVLQGQAESARLFRADQSRLERLEKALLYCRYRGFASKLEALLSREKAMKEEREGCSKKCSFLELSADEMRKHAEEKEAAYRRAREVFVSRQNEKELKIQAEAHTQERISELKEKQVRSEKELFLLKSQVESWSKEIASLRSDKERHLKEVEQEKGALLEKEKAFHLLEKNLQSVRSKQTAAHQERVHSFQREASLDSEWKQAKVRLETNQEKRELLLARGQNLALLSLEKEREVGDRQAKHASCYELILTLRQRLLDVEQVLKSLGAEKNALHGFLDEVSKELQDLVARERVLIQLKQEFAGFSSGSKKLLQASKNGKSGIYGLLFGLHEFVFAEKGEEALFATALKPYAETLVVQTKSDLKQILDYAKKESIRDFSLLCLEFFREKGLSNHFLDGIAIFPDLDLAIAHFLVEGKRCWSEPGCLLDGKGVLFFGGSEEQSIFSREAELKRLQGDIDIAKKRKLGFESALQEKRKEWEALHERRQEIDQEIRKKEMTGVEANFELQKSKSEYERLAKERAQVASEVENLDAILQQLAEKQEKILQDLQEAKEQVEKLQNAADELQTHVSSRSFEWEEKRKKLAEAKNAFAEAEGELRKVGHALNLIEVKFQETTRLIERLEHERRGAESVEKEYLSRSKRADGDIHELEKFLEKIVKQVEEFQEGWKEAEKKSKKLMADLKEMQGHLNETEGKLNDLKIQSAYVETSQEAIIRELGERFNTSVSELDEQEMSLQFSLEKTEKEVKQLKAALEKNSHVNLAAIEECEKHQERALHLKSQVEDLSHAKEELIKVIGLLDKESQRLFHETFEQIRMHFQKNFAILFKGGEADLELSKGTDFLDTGIEITAKPPGKQMRSLSLLSGGEKCLTAMALLFAIFEVKAAPFCVLDEIDAPLDDANVERFLNVVKEFVDRCQFIIVTHNKRTMALADRLYGVSMEKKGESKLLSVEFARGTKPEPVLVT